MHPRMLFKQLPTSRHVLISPPRRLAHNYNYKVYFPREPNISSFNTTPNHMELIYHHRPTYNYGHDHTSRFAQKTPHDDRFRDEPRWIRFTTYTACLMTLGLFWTWYEYREPTYCNERMQLSFLSDEAVDEGQRSRFSELTGEIGILEPFAQPFTVPEKRPEYMRISEVFDNLVAAGQLDIMDLKLYLMRNNNMSKSQFQIHPCAIVVNCGESMWAKTPGSVASMLAPRLASKAMNHQSELLNHFVFACLATIPAILFSVVAIRSKPARAFAVPYFWYYGALIGFQNTFLHSRQLNEADYVGLIIMSRAGYDISEAIDYRKRLVKEGEAMIEKFAESTQKIPFTVLRIKDIAQEKLGITKLHKWTATQGIHAANVERFVPMVKAKLAREVIHQIDDDEPKAEGDEGNDEEAHLEENEEERQMK